MWGTGEHNLRGTGQTPIISHRSQAEGDGSSPKLPYFHCHVATKSPIEHFSYVIESPCYANQETNEQMSEKFRAM